MKRCYAVEMFIFVDDDEWAAEYGVEVADVPADVVQDLEQWPAEWMSGPKWSSMGRLFESYVSECGVVKEIIV